MYFMPQLKHHDVVPRIVEMVRLTGIVVTLFAGGYPVKWAVIIERDFIHDTSMASAVTSSPTNVCASLQHMVM